MGLEPITFGLKGHCYTIKLCDQTIKKIKMEGFEPTTFGTQDRRSTAKLHLAFLINNFYGSSGIRTHGFFISNCFQDRYHKPLGHTSFFIEYVGSWTQNLWFTRPLLYQLSYIFNKLFFELKWIRTIAFTLIKRALYQLSYKLFL